MDGPRDRDAPTLIVDASQTAGDGLYRGDGLHDEQGLARGRQLEHYLVLGELGRGGMSVVYRAYDARLHREVALKVLRGAARDRDASARMLREARAMAQLAHPNVVPVYDAGTTDGHDWVAMELVSGDDLRRWLAGAHTSDDALSIIVAAGRGLAAAHAKGLVHRDFKPANVLVSPDGRVRVTDFGLARTADLAVSVGGGPDDADDDPRTALDTGPLSEPLTHCGTIVGTPAYMPPEQREGGVVDARSDQFAYCVAAWEALYGERPFPDDDTQACAAKAAHTLREPPDRAISQAVRAALTRGMSPDPEDRFPSMDALLDVLDRRPSATRRRWFVAAAGGIVVLAAALATRAAREQANRCTGGAARLQPIWSEARAEQIAAAFAGLDVANAGAAWQRARSFVDLYTERWLTMHREACEASTVRGEQTPAVHDLQQACLDDRLRHVDALLAVLVDPNEAVVRRAAKAASGLPELSPCADVEYLQARVPPPEDAEAAKQVEALRDRLRTAYAQETAGRYDTGVTLTQDALAEARALGYAPLVGELLRRRGSLAMQRGRYEDAVGVLREAFMISGGARDDETAAQCAIDLSFATSMSSRFSEAETWLRHAEMLSEAARLPVGFHARRMDRLGHVRSMQDRHEEALQQHRRALELVNALDEPDLSTVAQYEMHAAIALSDLDRYDESAAQYEQALRHHEQVLGEEHPDVGIVLLNMGMLHNQREQFTEALVPLKRARRIIATALGEEHTYIGNISMGLAVAHAGLLQWDEALPLAEQAVRVHAATFGAEHPQTANDHFNLGLLNHEAGRPEQARGSLQRALDIQIAVFGSDHATPSATREAMAELGL
ncbi:MAG: serine/threonine-protein kinase [Myxococcota bacterium]